MINSVLFAKVYQGENIVCSRAAFFFSRIEIEIYRIEPGGAQIENADADKPGSLTVTDLKGIGDGVHEKAGVIILRGCVRAGVSVF